MKKYSDLFPVDNNDANDNASSSSSSTSIILNADVIVVGAGIGGAPIAHHLSITDPKCRVIVLEQFDYDFSSKNNNLMMQPKPKEQVDSNSSSSSSSEQPQFRINHGSSRGGPRRIGLIDGHERTKKAWKAWQDLNNSESTYHDLMDVAGEVYVLNLFPFGWMLMILFGCYFSYQKYIQGKSLPKGLQFLWTSNSIATKLGLKQGFQSESPNCWKGCVGIYYDESAALHTDKILQYLLTNKKNLDVRYGTKVIKIEQQPLENKNDDDDEFVQVSVVQQKKEDDDNDKKEYYKLKCRHLVLACGGWTGELLKQFLTDNSIRNNPKSDDEYYYDPNDIHTKIESFTCPVYQISTSKPTMNNSNEDTSLSSPSSPSSSPPPFSIASKCPLFSCVNKKLYGFPVNHETFNKNNNEDIKLYIRPFFKATEGCNPDDQSTSDEQRAMIDDFVTNCLAVKDDTNISCSHYYTCRYPKLSLDNGKTFRSIMDFVPTSNQKIIVHAGLDGYSFKFGSIYGIEFMELLETGKPPKNNKNCHWPKSKSKDDRKSNIFSRLFVYFLARKEEEEEANNNTTTKNPSMIKKDK